jgi:ABC-2 type transport system ATP-binding protein
VILEAHALTKTYRRRVGRTVEEVPAVTGLDLLVKETEIFGLLGPNGAGKSTTMKILTTVLRPDSGSAHVVGHDLVCEPAAVRRGIGFVLQTGGLTGANTAREELILQGRLQGLGRHEVGPRVAEVLALVGAQEYADRPTGMLSGGERRRVEIALGLVHGPQLLFLDEPSLGLDPASRAALGDTIRLLQERGVTIVVSTHYLDEADALCDRIAIVDGGRVVCTGTPAELKREIAGDVLTLALAHGSDTAPAVRLLADRPDVVEVSANDNDLRVLVRDGDRAMADIVSQLSRVGRPVVSARVRRPSLDDVFLAHTGRVIDPA